jgi:hypothetical protein
LLGKLFHLNTIIHHEEWDEDPYNDEVEYINITTISWNYTTNKGSKGTCFCNRNNFSNQDGEQS